MTYKLSASSLKLMKECPTCFWWQVKKGVRRPTGPMSQLPNQVEAQLLKRFNEYRIKGKLPPELSQLNGMKLLKDQKKHDEWKNKGIKFSDTEKDFILVAKPDDILENGGKLVVLDYKTAGASACACTTEKFKKDIEKYDYQLQADIYNYVFRNNGLETEDYAYFLFLFLKEIDQEGRITLGSELIKTGVNTEHVETTLKEALETLNEEQPPITKCGFCTPPDER